MKQYKKNSGFTLIEILIALFIFTILAVLLTASLHNVITIQSGSERKAERLRQVQMGLLIMSRDIEQTINRPIIDASGKEEAAFAGTKTGFSLTHTGFANPEASHLQRTAYAFNENTIVRTAWPVLDQAPKTKAYSRNLIENVSEASFEYLDQQGHFRENWPMEKDAEQTLPRAVKINLTIKSWGHLTQLYLISAEDKKNPLEQTTQE
jgi:general secretion pathway protein J